MYGNVAIVARLLHAAGLRSLYVARTGLETALGGTASSYAQYIVKCVGSLG